jgi:hypothetical protein
MSTPIQDMANQVKIAIDTRFEQLKPYFVDELLGALNPKIDATFDSKLKLLEKQYTGFINGLQKELVTIKDDLETYKGDMWDYLKPKIAEISQGLGAPAEFITILQKVMGMKEYVETIATIGQGTSNLTNKQIGAIIGAILGIVSIINTLFILIK